MLDIAMVYILGNHLAAIYPNDADDLVLTA
jgi:hypothetical protein